MTLKYRPSPDLATSNRPPRHPPSLQPPPHQFLNTNGQKTLQSSALASAASNIAQGPGGNPKRRKNLPIHPQDRSSPFCLRRPMPPPFSQTRVVPKRGKSFDSLRTHLDRNKFRAHFSPQARPVQGSRMEAPAFQLCHCPPGSPGRAWRAGHQQMRSAPQPNPRPRALIRWEARLPAGCAKPRANPQAGRCGGDRPAIWHGRLCPRKGRGPPPNPERRCGTLQLPGLLV